MAMDNTNEDTSNFLNWVEIKNFKSIKDLRLDCKITLQRILHELTP